MDTLNFHHLTHEDNLDELKFAALYFDKIEIPVFESISLEKSEKPGMLRAIAVDCSVTDTYLTHVKILESEGIVKIDKRRYPDGRGNNAYFLSAIPNGVGKLVGDNLGRFFANPVGKEIFEEGKRTLEYEGDFIEELKTYSSNLIEKRGKAYRYSPYFNVILIASQVDLILSNINSGKLTLNTSSIINSFIKDFFCSSKFKRVQHELKSSSNIETQISMEALKLHLPNISKLSFEDILELRHLMKDELNAFQAEMKLLSINFNKDQLFGKEELSNYVLANVTPKLKSVEFKLGALNQKFIKSIIAEIKDPKSYSPLLLSFFDNVSNSLIILFSLGLISFDVIIEHLESKKEIKTDGLYFLANLRNKTK
jgi:hypothetical protein